MSSLSSFRLLGAAALCCGLTVQAHAASITMERFSVATYQAQQSGMTEHAMEDFESFRLIPDQDGRNPSLQTPDGQFSTNVGTFRSVGGTGSGGTVTVPNPDLDGSRLALRTGNVYGRESTTDNLTGDPVLTNFLDSNDTLGIDWDVMLAGQQRFNRLVFVVTDAGEFGTTLRIEADGTTERFANLGSSNKQVVTIRFDRMMTAADVSLTHTNGNDGFSMDDVSVGVVPLPAGGLLLITGLAAAAILRRRQVG